MKSINELLSEMKTRKSGVKFVHDWRSRLPAGSRWNPGDPGKADCKICEGIGYLRVDLPIGHPDFGKLFLCECTNGRVKQMPALPSSVSSGRFLPDPYEEERARAFETGEVA